MKGDLKVVEYLNRSLRHELTAVNQYWLHYRLLHNWGYLDLAKKWRQESIEEMQHADKLIDRIIFLDGFPRTSGTTVRGADLRNARRVVAHFYLGSVSA